MNENDTGDNTLSSDLAQIRDATKGIELSAIDKIFFEFGEATQDYNKTQAVIPVLFCSDSSAKLHAARELKRSFDRLDSAVNNLHGCCATLRQQGDEALATGIEEQLAPMTPLLDMMRKAYQTNLAQVVEQIMSAAPSASTTEQSEAQDAELSVNPDTITDPDKRIQVRLRRFVQASNTIEQQHVEALKVIADLRALSDQHRQTGNQERANHYQSQANLIAQSLQVIEAALAGVKPSSDE